MENYKPVKIAYKLFEPATGEDNSLCPVIFLHGLSGTRAHWLNMPQVIADKTKRKVYAIDARNHGDSEFNDVFDFEANAVDLIHFMDTMDISKAALVGHSMGGMTAMLVALNKPEKVEMFFSGDMHTSKLPEEVVGGILNTMRLSIAAAKAIPLGLSEKEAVKCALDWTYDKLEKEFNITPTVPKENMLNGRARLRSKPDGTYDVCFNKPAILAFLENYDKDCKSLSGQYNGPAFFIYGTASKFNVANEEDNLKKHFPRAELIEFEGATHDVVGDCWDRFIDTVLAGLKK